MLAQVDSAALALPSVRWLAVLAPILLIGGALVLLAVATVVPGRVPRHLAAVVTAVVGLAAAGCTVPLWLRVSGTRAGDGPFTTLAGAVTADRFAVWVTWIICGAVVLSALLLDDYLRRQDLDGLEAYVLLLLAAGGGAVIASAADLIVLFIGIEILSIATYALTALHVRRVSSLEAALKYFVLGGFASAFLLYGVALTYGATGTTNLFGVRQFLSQNSLTDSSLLMGGLAMLLVGLGFKVAAAPFHMWTPDVYQGAPTPITGWMASGVKAAAFAGMLRVFVGTFGPQIADWRPALAALAVLSLVVGSVMAIAQTEVKRMLAYSSIVHAGFLLVGVDAATDRGTSAVLFYLAVYALLALGSFGILSLLAGDPSATGADGGVPIASLRGLGRSRGGLALGFTVLLLAQAGIPFTGGFMAKFGVIAASVDAGRYWLAIAAMIAAVVAAFLYLRIIAAIYFEDADDFEDAGVSVDSGADGVGVRSPLGVVAVVVSVVGVVALGLLPNLARSLTDNSPARVAPPPTTAAPIPAGGFPGG